MNVTAVRDARNAKVGTPGDETKAAQCGWDNPTADTDAMYSSAIWLAFHAGRALHKAGLTRPLKATSGRGYAVNLWTAVHKYKVHFSPSLNACHVESL